MIVFQIEVSRAVGGVCVGSTAKAGVGAADGFRHRGDCPAAWPVNKTRGKNTTKRRAQRQTTELSIAPPRLAIRSHCAVVPGLFDVTWVTQAVDLLWSLKIWPRRWGLHHGQRSNFFVAALMASSYAWTAGL